MDASSAMLKELIRHAGKKASRIHAECADIRDRVPAGEGYDLIVSHFFLDCLTSDEIHQLAEELRRISLPSALWIISEFAIPQSAYGRWLARPLVASLYRAFGALTGLGNRSLPDHRTALLNSGFTLKAKRHFLGGLLVSELWALAEP